MGASEAAEEEEEENGQQYYFKEWVVQKRDRSNNTLIGRLEPYSTDDEFEFQDDPSVYVPDWMTTMPAEEDFAAGFARFRTFLLSTINMKLSIKQSINPCTHPSEIQDPKSKIKDPKSSVQNQKCKIPNPKYTNPKI